MKITPKPKKLVFIQKNERFFSFLDENKVLHEIPRNTSSPNAKHYETLKKGEIVKPQYLN